MVHWRVTPLSCFSFLFFPFFVLSQKRFLMDVPSVVGAPWRCGVLTTQGGKAGIGLGHLREREHDASLQSVVEAPRPFKTESRQIR